MLTNILHRPGNIQNVFCNLEVYQMILENLSLYFLINTLFSFSIKAVLGDFDYDTCMNNYLSPFRDLRKHCVISSGDNSTGI